MKTFLALIAIALLTVQGYAEPASGKHYQLDLPVGWARDSKSAATWSSLDEYKHAFRCSISEIEPSASTENPVSDGHNRRRLHQETPDQKILNSYSRDFLKSLKINTRYLRPKYLQIAGRPAAEITEMHEAGAEYDPNATYTIPRHYENGQWIDAHEIPAYGVRTKKGVNTYTHMLTVLCPDNSAVIVIVQGFEVSRKPVDARYNEIVRLLQIK